ncbi:uncharacterized protein VP01_2189g2 [Puccinia sorghi]|uniref:Uncharacterized protein n=1 Tax=Puccinia sorghi TaxID=27349 RepID=A0A0L6V987_9BASI|nr:uncharacterized protein VP01_2189g2 [Puccinia sorghi]
MPTTRSTSKKPSGDVGQPIADNPALSKFLANPNSYVSYIDPQLKSDGSNMSQWIDSVNDLTHLLFGVKNFLADDSNFDLLDEPMDWSFLHVLKFSIALDVQPILKDADSALDALKTLKKNFHKSTRVRQLELINSLLHLDDKMSASHFNSFFSIMSQLSSIGVDLSPLVQGLLLQTLTAPPPGTSKTHLNNLILAAAEKSDDKLGPRDIQVIYNSLQSDVVDGDGTAANSFAINLL